ncbi:AraC family transcriptional regulator [Streptomyces armeniacus]|uniref:AraC family transcriptional regulator n=1 Tax=Streptomyces armeniacus TaxID=83291 RepID=A0A345XJS4_9ACTN|nr:AraC family transcriptional regulator [Streptomyces armeniacus]AXK31890.1 AraC family transcriptional regulator [Streptomyces armeniacus]
MTTPHLSPFWRSLTVERHPTPENGSAAEHRAPDGWFGIVTPVRGSCRIEGHDGGGLRRTTLVPGEICRLAPGNLVRLSRKPPRHQPFAVASVGLSAAVLRYSAEAHPATAGRDRDLASLHTLRAFDPHVASMASVLLRARAAGAGDDYADGAARYLAAHLLHAYGEATPSAHGLNAEQLRAVTSYMRENLAADITLDHLAKQARMSRYHFIRRFTATTGQTPLRYLTQRRIETARHLLVLDADPIADIARRCGYPRRESFARAFRTHTGCSPSQYRKRVGRG